MSDSELKELGNFIQKMHDKLRKKNLEGNDLEFQTTYAAIEKLEELYYFHKKNRTK